MNRLNYIIEEISINNLLKTQFKYPSFPPKHMMEVFF